jgi:hypothetical protein
LTYNQDFSGLYSSQTLGWYIQAIYADTNELQTDDVPGLIGALNDISSANVTTACTSSLNTYDPPSKAEMDTAHGLLATVAKQDVIDGIVDAILAMLDDARTEPGQGAPPVNPDAMTKLDYLYKAWRNKSTQTATEYKVYNDAGAVVDQKATVSDDATTATRGKVGTGP